MRRHDEGDWFSAQHDTTVVLTMKRGSCEGRFNAADLFDRGGDARCAAPAVQLAVLETPRSLCRVIPQRHLF